MTCSECLREVDNLYTVERRNNPETKVIAYSANDVCSLCLDTVVVAAIRVPAKGLPTVIMVSKQ